MFSIHIRSTAVWKCFIIHNENYKPHTPRPLTSSWTSHFNCTSTWHHIARDRLVPYRISFRDLFSLLLCILLVCVRTIMSWQLNDHSLSLSYTQTHTHTHALLFCSTWEAMGNLRVTLLISEWNIHLTVISEAYGCIEKKDFYKHTSERRMHLLYWRSYILCFCVCVCGFALLAYNVAIHHPVQKKTQVFKRLHIFRHRHLFFYRGLSIDFNTDLMTFIL